MSDSLFNYPDEQYTYTVTNQTGTSIQLSAYISALDDLVFTQDSTPPSGAKTLPNNQDAIIYADTVIIRGPISMPGRRLTIVARVIDTQCDSNNSPASISVSGTAGTTPITPNLTIQAAAGAKGSPGNNQGFEKGQPGGQGGTGQNGRGGAAGDTSSQLATDAGYIEIYAGGFAATGGVLTLSADGGTGAAGEVGQQGGNGGPGGDGAPGFRGRDGSLPCSDGGPGGPGGKGGPSGAGGSGANAGTILVYGMSLSNCPVFSVGCGAGGAGGVSSAGGNPGTGGNPGSGPPGCNRGGPGGPGSTGEQGSQGRPGAPGSVCLLGSDNSITVYRYYEPLANVHYWSTEPESANWRPEGGAFEAYQGYVPGTVPVYHYAQGIKHYYTFEFGDPNAKGWSYLGIAWFLHPTQAAAPVGALPLKHFTLPAYGLHFYTADPNEIPGGWTYVDNLGYVLTQGSLPAQSPSYDGLALYQSSAQCAMALQRAELLYLSADPDQNPAGYQQAATLLAWLQNVTAYFNADPPPTPPSFSGLTPDDVTLLGSIYQKANALASQLARRVDYFGNGPSYVPLASYVFYSNLLATMLNDLSTVESAYATYFTSLSNQQTLATQLQATEAQAQATITNLTNQLDPENQSGLPAQLVTIGNTIDGDVTAVAYQKTVLLAAISNFQHDLEVIAGANCVMDTMLKALGCLTVIQDTAFLKKASAIATSVKGVVDSALSPAYTRASAENMISRVDVLNVDVSSLQEGFTANGSLLTSTDPNAYKLLMDQTSLNNMMEPYLSKTWTEADAQVAINAMNTYVQLVMQLNNDIVAYNTIVGQIVAAQGQLAQAQQQLSQAQDTLAQNTDPALPPMVAYMSTLYQSRKADCIYQLYMANKALSFWSLDTDDTFFYNLLGLNAPAGTDTAVLKSGQSQILTQLQAATESYGTNASPFPATAGATGIEYAITQPDVLQALIANNELYVSIPAALKDATIQENPFAGAYDVRITVARAWFTGAVTSDNIIHAEVTHTGVETIVDKSGNGVAFSHDPVTQPFICDYSKSPPVIVQDTVFGIGDSGQPSNTTGSATPEPVYTLIGPFTMWKISVPAGLNNNLDLSKVTKVVMEFHGASYAFPSQG